MMFTLAPMPGFHHPRLAATGRSRATVPFIVDDYFHYSSGKKPTASHGGWCSDFCQ
ncbi:hypothetical protein GTCCBUS3UF5_13230 [Geobacillus thermoleovorans CCB_US3_UF5]|uniref:Uncharacterized protein n=1 Tax=Geobacillus thermoleovorans CCB_US3_UF5 TaxID=1111068 RepID=A0ABM5MG71_GEOTH|nr:hypothetical protein GTCCBUS3UF5_13230 [Geobacillus thermoleovorans CCB_US3_UF5]